MQPNARNVFECAVCNKSSTANPNKVCFKCNTKLGIKICKNCNLPKISAVDFELNKKKGQKAVCKDCTGYFDDLD